MVDQRPTLQEWQQMLGELNWALNILPLARAGLNSSYQRIRTPPMKQENHSKAPKHRGPHTRIYHNRSTVHDLLWFASRLESCSGVHIIRSQLWPPQSAQRTAFVDACLDGLGIFLPPRGPWEQPIALFCRLEGDPIYSDILHNEMLAILCALLYFANHPEQDLSRVLIYSDSLDSVNIFHSFSTSSSLVAPVLMASADVIMEAAFHLTSFMFPGKTTSKPIVSCGQCSFKSTKIGRRFGLSAFNPLAIRWGRGDYKMEFAQPSRQPPRKPWTREELLRARTIALGFTLELSTRSTYQSGLNSYLAFAKAHNFPLPPTLDSVSFFVVYMSHHIDPKSVANYVHGLMRSLEPQFPEIRAICHSALVKETLAGCKKWRGKPISRKPPLLANHVLSMIERFKNSSDFDDTLFLAITLLGHFGLHRLGELTSSDILAHRSHRKLIKRPSATQTSIGLSYILPYHKADGYFLGNTIIIASRLDNLDPVQP